MSIEKLQGHKVELQAEVGQLLRDRRMEFYQVIGF